MLNKNVFSFFKNKPNKKENSNIFSENYNSKIN